MNMTKSLVVEDWSPCAKSERPNVVIGNAIVCLRRPNWSIHSFDTSAISHRTSVTADTVVVHESFHAGHGDHLFIGLEKVIAKVEFYPYVATPECHKGHSNSK